MKIATNSKTYPEHFAQIDEADLHLLEGGTLGTLYHRRNDCFRTVLRKNGEETALSRIIVGAKEGEQVDHINHDTEDDRRENLRITTPSQNMMNSKKCRTHTTSRYKGVSWINRDRKWQASIKVDGSDIYLGSFDQGREEDAARAYNEAAKELFGEFALLNDVPPLFDEMTPEERKVRIAAMLAFYTQDVRTAEN